MPSSISEGQYRLCINQARPLSAPAPQRREATTRTRCHYRRAPGMTHAGARRLLLSRPRTRPSLAHVSRCGAFIGVRSHHRRARGVTPSPYRRVPPLSAHMRDNTSHYRPISIEQRSYSWPTRHNASHYRRAKPLSAHVSNDAEPLSARQAIIGTRARQREPPVAYAPNTAKPLSARAVRIGAHDPPSDAIIATSSHYRPT